MHLLICFFFSTILSTRNKELQSNPIQSDDSYIVQLPVELNLPSFQSSLKDPYIAGYSNLKPLVKKP